MGTITVINATPYKKQPLPEVGKEYHVFDDGKIKPSRHGIVKVTGVYPFKEFTDNAVMSTWAEEVTECYWLYANETDYFIKAEYDDKRRTSYFVRTKDGGWFSLGWWASRLDINGDLYNKMIEWFGEEIK